MPDHAAQETQEELAAGQFRYFGEIFRYAPVFPQFELDEFHMLRAEDDVDESLARGKALATALACVHEADRARFRQVSRKNRAQLSDWIVVIQKYTAAEADRPTSLPADSTDGHSNDQPSSATQSDSGSASTQPEASVTPLPTARAAKRAPRGDMAACVARSEGLA